MDNSRRITAANLARMKAEEIKADFALIPEYPANALSKFRKLSTEIQTGTIYTIDRNKAIAGKKVMELFSGLLEPSRPVDDGSQAGGGAVYHYEVELSKLRSDRTTQLEEANQVLFALHMGERLIHMVVTVSWTAGENALPHPRRRIRLDTYLTGG